MAMARDFGEKIHHQTSATGNSGHFYVDRDGSVEQWVPENRVAHHVRDHNHNSLGIELINTGRYPDWFDSRKQEMLERYPEQQVAALVELLSVLCGRLENLTHITGHEDLDQGTVPASDNHQLAVRRKLDPGPLFPWEEVMKKCALERLRP